MSRQSFTPGRGLFTSKRSTRAAGPLQEQNITISSGEVIVASYSTRYAEYPDDSINEANARLIAAAPELLEALELVSDLAGREWQEADGSRKGATDNSGKRMWFIGDDVMLLVRERIAKARGDA